jgi:uroporphyrinogen-III synthase
VALTREDGKNGKLSSLLEKEGVLTVEIPCIAHGVGEGRVELPNALQKPWSYVVCTSPEAAAVLLQGWAEAGKPEGLNVASVGASTSAALAKGGMAPVFEPTKATAETLAKELPDPTPGVDSNVLYPASSKATHTLQDGLEARGYAVTRLNTYTTEPAAWDIANLEAAKAARVVTFASPSAVKVWAERVGTGTPVACIGETSGEASKRAGFESVAWPESPGMEGWVASVLKQLGR